MPSSRQLKTKIRSVKNIKQITKAVQMVSATKMRRSQEVALNARPYAEKSLTLLLYLLNQAKESDNTSSGLLEEREGNKVALIVITSDKGLAGSFNSSVLRQASKWKNQAEKEGKQVDVLTVGRKGRDYFKKRGANLISEFMNFGDVITFNETKPIADLILNAYKNKTYDKIFICSNWFVSALIQKVEIHQILPVVISEIEKTVEGIIPKTGKYSDLKDSSQFKNINFELPFILEPSREIIMESLVTNLIQVEIMHFIFESNAGEHSARMIAMKNATENANRLQNDLTIKLNKARQASITQELTEIATAKEALTS